mmetsp:Transcript_18362/g.26739  ORF Transcript_18362/g.26739 Transcript_18362/m.26739 type:complete len:108 (+) Transcript_18362:856-1179(+)
MMEKRRRNRIQQEKYPICGWRFGLLRWKEYAMKFLWMDGWVSVHHELLNLSSTSIDVVKETILRTGIPGAEAFEEKVSRMGILRVCHSQTKKVTFRKENTHSKYVIF